MFYVIKVNYYELNRRTAKFDWCESYVCPDAFESMASATNYLNENSAELMPSGKYRRFGDQNQSLFIYEIVSVNLSKGEK